MLKKTIRIVWKTVKWGFIVFSLFFVSLFFHDLSIPSGWVEEAFERFAPANLVLHLDSLSFGFRRGLILRGFKIYDAKSKNPLAPMVSASSAAYYPFLHRLRIEELKYPRLPDGYYAPGTVDRNERVEATFPELFLLSVDLVRPDVLGIRPESLTFDVEVSSRRIDFNRMRLVWPDRESRMGVEGTCYVDIDRQEVFGEVDGLARQSHIRPLLEALDVPVAFPYFDGFTEVPEPCKSRCRWKVDLVRNDFDLWLELHPILGKYNGVPMKRADGKIHLHNCTRNNCLNYVTTVGPIAGVDVEGRKLDGTVVIVGTNGYNTVTVKANSSQPLADVLKIGGFEGDYVGNDVFGNSTCDLEFRFPRAMTNNYEVLNGQGHIEVKDGQLMRMKGFKGLIEAMPRVAPAVTWFTDSTQASCDYVITNGIVKTDNVYIEGSMFSIKMYGQFDAVANDLDFVVRVQFAKKDSFAGKILHPLAWPFTKLLLEFKLKGSSEDPKWSYISVIDRVLESVL